MSRLTAVSIAGLALAMLVACTDTVHSKDKVQQAIIERLRTRSGLDLSALDVNTTSVAFDKNRAVAVVSFHPKDNPNLNSGMVMKYTLQYQDGKWVVMNVGDGHGGPPGMQSMGRGNGNSGSTLPPGHPSIGSGEKQQ